MQIAARATSEGADLTPADNGVSAFSSGPEPELALHAAPSAETLTVSATRPGTVFVTLTTPGRTWCARALPFARPGKMTLPVPMLDGIVTASALSTSSSAEVRIQ